MSSVPREEAAAGDQRVRWRSVSEFFGWSSAVTTRKPALNRPTCSRASLKNPF